MNNNSSKKNINNNYKINIIRHSGKDENLININNPNSLFLDTQTPNRKKSSLQVKMESAFCTKKYKNENGTSGAKILKEFHKSKSLKFAIAKDSESNLEKNTNTVKLSKKEVNTNKENISPEIKHNINYNININNSNTNEIFDLLKFTNNLYNQEGHLQKELPTKKLDINNLSKFDKNFNKDLTKKKLFIQFGLNDVKRKSFKSSNEIPKDNKDKTNFSNYLKIKQKENFENSENSGESEEDMNNNYNLNRGDFTSKSTKNAQFNFNKMKNKKSKKIKNKIIIYEQIEQENEKDNSKPKSRQTTKTKKESPKKFSKKISKNKNGGKEELKINNNDKIEKKKKFNFWNCFCCLNK